MIRGILSVVLSEMIVKSLIGSFYFAWFCRYRVCKAWRGIVVVMVTLAVFYGGIAHAGAVYSWTKTMGGTSEDYGHSVAVDGRGNVYVTGIFTDTVDFNPGVGIDRHTSVGLLDVFLTKINSNGTYGWTETMGGANDDYGQSVAVDDRGNVYLAGYFTGTVDFDPDGTGDNHESAGLLDIFLTKINSNGSYSWTKTMGGRGEDVGWSVAVDDRGNVYVTGYFSRTADFDPDGTGDNHESAGLGDIFFTKINSDGSYGWTKTMGGRGEDVGWSVAVDDGGNVYVTGYFSRTADFDPDGTGDNHESAGLLDIFLTKINSNDSYGWTETMGGSDIEEGLSVTVDTVGSFESVYVTGYFDGTTDFEPGTGTDNHTSAGFEDIFLTKFEMEIPPWEDGDDDGNCFIATAAFGSSLDPHVRILREFRDKYLLSSTPGTAIVVLYYKYSPPIAHFIAGHDFFRFATRWALTPIVYGVKYPFVTLLVSVGFISGIVVVYRRKRKYVNEFRKRSAHFF